MGKAVIPLSRLRSTLRDGRSAPWSERHRRHRGGDIAQSVGEALRSRVYKIGPVFHSHNPPPPDKRKFDDRNTYVIRIRGREYRWELVERWLGDVYRRDPDAWALQEYLWAKEPTRSQFLIARPHLIQLWNYLNGN